MAGFLLVDSAVGFIQIYLGLHVPVSMIYKTPVLLLVILIIFQRDIKFAYWILAALLSFLAGPIIQLFTYNDPSALFYDLTLALKILSPVLYLRYFIIAAEELPNQFRKVANNILLFSCGVFVANMLVGLMGFGFASYTTAGKDIGINGFFIAGNEMGAVFVVLSSFILTKAYHRSLKSYLLISLMIIIIGVLIATKASMLSGFLLVFLLPAFINAKKVFTPTLPKVIVSITLIIILYFLSIKFIDVLKSAGFWSRLVWIYEEQGILRLILSGRDEYADALLIIFNQHGHWYNWLIGMSSASAKHFWIATKLVAEVDPIDVLMIFGFLGLSVAAIIQFTLLQHAVSWFKLSHSPLAPACLLSLLVLEGLAFTSGHIWLSGMMGPFLGLMFGLCYLESKNKI